jgi:SAM-dependent methyltransferase
MSNRGKTPTSWYTEEGGFFGPGYLKEYTDLITPERTKTEVDFLENILPLERGVRMLDLACGHGRHTVELARRGWMMTGQDINAFFLKEAARAAECVGVEVRWVHSDMRHIPFEEEFDIVINLFTAFGYLESDEEDQRVVQEVAKALRPMGTFVLDVINRERVIRFYRDNDWRRLEDGSVALTEGKFDVVTGRNYERRLRIWQDGTREEFSIVVRMYTLTELIALCTMAGLKFKEVYGSYKGEPLGLDSPRCILIAEKI